jgi:hypothetical protein
MHGDTFIPCVVTGLRRALPYWQIRLVSQSADARGGDGGCIDDSMFPNINGGEKCNRGLTLTIFAYFC